MGILTAFRQNTNYMVPPNSPDMLPKLMKKVTFNNYNIHAVSCGSGPG